DARAVPFFRSTLEKMIAGNPENLIVNVKDLQSMVSAAARALIFAKQKLSVEDDVVFVGANDAIKELLNQDEFSESVSFSDN
ncbi:MAG: STAS domain-containing protein, partial [Rhodoferax sp.]|nr:STAS domain-containing protein [Rhodoferax sp.]